MNVSEWPLCMKCSRVTCDYCAYGAPYRKTTDFWTSLDAWVPCGVTSDGRCHCRCGQGGWVPGEGSARYFQHFIALANDPIDGIRGPGSARMINHIPLPLCSELLQVSKKGKRVRRILIDLCAGHQSMKDAAHANGWDYIAVDIRKVLV